MPAAVTQRHQSVKIEIAKLAITASALYASVNAKVDTCSARSSAVTASTIAGITVYDSSMAQMRLEVTVDASPMRYTLRFASSAAGTPSARPNGMLADRQ